MMTKTSSLLLCLSAFSGAICAEQTDPCAGLSGSALTQCRSNQQTLRQQLELERQLQQQEERQNQLDKQQREVQQQLESMRLQNESLRKQLERESASQAARPVATDYPKNAEVKNPEVKNAEIKSWREANPWYGTDYARTQFATRYIKQLQQERPDLTGRDLLDALSAKVNETFGQK
jgi:TolA-binding protein